MAGQVTALSSAGQQCRSGRAVSSASRARTYDAASDLLGQLTDYNVAAAAQASERSVRAFERARWLMGGGLAAAA